MAGKSKGGVEDIMSTAEMKPLLAKAKHGNPVNCAIGLTKEKDGVVLLHKAKKPKALMSELKKSALDAGVQLDTGSLRFGNAAVSGDDGDGLLTFTVNKEAPGMMQTKILQLVRKAGVGKIEIVVDAGLEDESEQSETAEETESAEVPEPPAGKPDIKPLMGALQTLVGQIGQADPAQVAQLKAIAAKAAMALKAEDLAGAQVQIEALRSALDQPSSDTGSGGPPKPNPALAKARLAWTAARGKVQSELDKLHAQIVADFTGHGASKDVDAFFRGKVGAVMGQFDASLADKLDEALNAQDAGKHAKLIGEAKQIIAKYKSYVGTPEIAELDSNPFVPLSIGKTMTATLAALEKVVT